MSPKDINAWQKIERYSEYVRCSLTYISIDILMRPDDLFRDKGRVNESDRTSHSEPVGRLRFYTRFNHLLDQQVVPYTINESTVVAFREELCRKGNPDSLCYWLLMARLAELTLLCAGHYADCGEVTAAGDLLVNPRRADIYMQGVVPSIRKYRHRRLSEQLDPGGLSPRRTHGLVEAQHNRQSHRTAASTGFPVSADAIRINRGRIPECV